MGTIKDKIIQFGKYVIRDELDIRRRFLNVALVIIFLIQIPTIILNFAVGSNILGTIVQLGIVPVVILEFWDLNKHPNSMRPLIIVVLACDFIIFPLMYFFSGGHRSAMPLWLVMGGIFIFILLDGTICYILGALYMAIIVAMPCIELKHSEFVKILETETDEVTDQLVGMTILIFSFGLLFMYQRISYESQRKRLEEQREKLQEQEKALASANARLEEANGNLANLNKELENANEELEAASEAKSNFLANMSHEIRTPINAVLGMDEMILRECEDESILRYASDIDSAGHQLLALINDILDFSKIESGKMEIHPAEYEMFSIINDCYNMINMRARKKNLDFKVENDPNLPSYMIGDEVRVRQIIMNLLTNAVKYTKDGYVKLSISRRDVDEDHIILHVEVKDTGSGISKENQEKLFFSFQRIDEIKNRNIEGTGLGLAITKKFVDLMNGEISVISEVDEGSTFIVDIPQEIASKTPMGDFASRYNKRADTTSRKKGGDMFTAPDARVMVVDDVKMNLNVVRLLLKNTKIQVDMASSGKECLQLSMLKSYDVILMDHMMPEMDGIQTMHELKKVKNGLNFKTPVIALTANAIVGVEEMYRKEGFVDYMSKPIKGENLENMLMKYIPKEKIILNEG